MDKKIEVMNYPFVFISSLMRTGSTVVQESLTQLPYSFIFHEPQLCRNKFDIKDVFLNDLKVDIKKLIHSPMIKTFSEQIVPLLQHEVKQIGVKEIENKGWENYFKHFSDVKIILTGRDPRDIYISIYYWFEKKKTNKWKNGKILSPKVLYNDLMKEFEMQKQMYIEKDTIKIRYEDFCIDTHSTFQKMKYHINSPIPEIGEVGGFLSNNQKRIGEFVLHGTSVTESSVYRWKQEKNEKLIKQANKFYDLMEDYCKFWGY